MDCMWLIFVILCGFFPVFLLGSPATPKSATESVESRVNLTVYIESQCPDTARFLAYQFLPAWNSGMGQVADVTLVPYGKAHATANGTAVDPMSGQPIQDHNFTCQHGAKECATNQYMLCGIERLLRGSDAYVRFVLCAQMKSVDEASICADLHGLDFKELRACTFNAHGRYLHYLAGLTTAEIESPALSFVPTVALDGAIDRPAYENLANRVCRAYEARGGPKKSFCSAGPVIEY